MDHFRKPLLRLLPSWLLYLLLIVVLLQSSLAQAQVYEKKGLFRVTVQGWLPSEISEASHTFTCIACRYPAQVRITYTTESVIDVRFRSNESFLDSLSSSAEQRTFALDVMESLFPKGTPMDILKTKRSELGGLKVFLFQAMARTKEGLARRTIMMAVHHGRQVMVSLNYFEGSMDKASKKLIRDFLDSIRFL